MCNLSADSVTYATDITVTSHHGGPSCHTVACQELLAEAAARHAAARAAWTMGQRNAVTVTGTYSAPLSRSKEAHQQASYMMKCQW